MTSKYYDLMFRVGCNKICSAWNKAVARHMNKKYPIWLQKHRSEMGVNTTARKDKIVISLTTFPPRFDKVHLTIECMLHQTIRPDKVVLWLCEDECKNVRLPETITGLCQYGLEIRYAKENLKPHNKFIYSALEYKDSIIITVDDDIIYDHRMVETLLKGYKMHSDCVICNMAHEIVLGKDGKPDTYDRWHGGAIGKTGPSFALVALGVGGVLYPPNIFDDVYFNMELIKKMALTADDLWLKYNEVRLGVRVYKVHAQAKNPVTISKSQAVSLTSINNGNGRNNAVIKALNNFFSLDWKRLFEEEQ